MTVHFAFIILFLSYTRHTIIYVCNACMCEMYSHIEQNKIMSLFHWIMEISWTFLFFFHCSVSHKMFYILHENWLWSLRVVVFCFFEYYFRLIFLRVIQSNTIFNIGESVQHQIRVYWTIKKNLKKWSNVWFRLPKILK